MTFIRIRRKSLAVVASAAVALAAGGCSNSWLGGPGKEPPCMPPEYSISPKSAMPGEMVTVAAVDADCNPRYGDDAQIQIFVIDQAGVKVINTTTDMNDAGGFSYSFDVPAQTADGLAQVTAMPYGVDWCDDTGTNNRVAGESVVLERVSCAMPVKPLSITAGVR